MTSTPSGVADAAGSQGQEMVADSTICQASPTRCQARMRLYRDGRLELEGFPAGFIASLVTIILAALVLFIIFKRKDWL